MRPAQVVKVCKVNMSVKFSFFRKKMLFISIWGLFALAWSGAYAQDAKIFTIKDFNEGGNANPVLQVARFFSVNQEGKLEWVEQGPFMNSMWYQIPVEGSETDFYLKNVATGQYVYRGYLTEDVEQGDEGFSRNPATAGWNWDFAYLSSTIVEGKEEYFQFRALPARWGWATDLVNVAGAIWENHGDEKNPAFGFVINGQHKFTPSISGDITNVGGALEYPAAGIMRCTDNGQQGNAWTVVHFDEVSAGTELIKRKVRIEDTGDGGPTSYLGVKVDEENGNSVEWFYTSGKLSVIGDITAWYEIPVSMDEDNLDFYYKNVATGEYLYREGTQKADACGDWCKEPALVASEIDEEAPGYFQFRLIESKWGGRSYLVNVVDANWEAWADMNVDNKTNTGMCITGVGVNWGDWEYPKAWIAGIGDGSNFHGSVKVDVASEVQYYTVTFNKTNGTANEVKAVKEDDKVSKIADPTRINYKFLGWSLEQQGEDDGADELEEYDFDTLVSESFTIYAWWEYEPEPIVDRPERKVRILNWGNNVGIDGKFITYAYLGENEGGELEWIEVAPESLNDYTAWIEIPVAGSNYLNYYKNAATGKYIYRSVRDIERKVDKNCDEKVEECEMETYQQTLPTDGAWKWEYALLSEEIDQDIVEYYQFWPIIKGDWGGRVHLANMGGVTAENPFTQTGAAFYLGPINSNHGGDGYLAYPKVVMSSLNDNNGNVWASVLIEPVITQVRIQDWGDGNKPPKFLAIVKTKETVDGKETDVFHVEWSDKDDDNSIWDEMLVDGSTTDYYYRNFGTTSRNHGTGQFLYRDVKDFEGDWGQAQALASNRYAGGDEYYQFRKMDSNWDDHSWMVNMADAEFAPDGKFIDKKAFVLSGINKDLDMDYKYPAALMHIMPDKGNCWGSVSFIEVGQKRKWIVTFNMNGGGGNLNISMTEGDLAECPEEPTRQGYEFMGWFYDDKTFKNAYDCDNPKVVTENFTIYANWKEDIPSPDCTPDIKKVRFGNFGDATRPRDFLRVTAAGSLVWYRYDNAGAGYGKDFDPNDKNAEWYQIPVPGSNFDYYYKNVATGLYLYLIPESGCPGENEGEFLGTGGAWRGKAVGLSDFNHKTANYKWRILRGAWQDQEWNACYLANAFDAKWEESGGVFVISGHKRLHTDPNFGCGVPSDYETVHAMTIGDTYLNNGNAWCATSLWVDESQLYHNPDCCDGGVECCGGILCENICIYDPNDPCECKPESDECLFFCDLHPNHERCKTQSAPEIKYFEDLKVFPNPTNNLLNISGLKGGELITIYEISGRRVLNTIATGELTSIAVSHLPKGAYIVKVSNTFGEFSTKFIIN